MTFETFVESVDNLVLRWATSEGVEPVIPREKLQAIYDDVREQGVYGLAQAIQQRDAAVSQLHKQYLAGIEPKKQKGKTNDRPKPTDGTVTEGVSDAAQ